MHPNIYQDYKNADRLLKRYIRLLRNKGLFYQRTIKENIVLVGVGLHSGHTVRMKMFPAPPDTGVVFVVDGHKVRADHHNVFDTSYATTLQSGGVKVRTVEHLLSAFAGLRVDNVYVDINGPEVPILDGSAWPIVKAIMDAGLAVQKTPRRYIKIVKPVTVHEGDKSATLLPALASRITYRIDFDHPLLGDQSFSVDLGPEVYGRELAPARTFGFMRDAEYLRKAGLARGASLENAVVVGEERILNEEGLRFPDEFVRHKMLDALGDLYLAGMPFIGHLVADKSGHRLNQRLVREVMSRSDCWILLDGGQEDRPVDRQACRKAVRHEGAHAQEDVPVGLAVSEVAP